MGGGGEGGLLRRSGWMSVWANSRFSHRLIHTLRFFFPVATFAVVVYVFVRKLITVTNHLDTLYKKRQHCFISSSGLTYPESSNKIKYVINCNGHTALPREQSASLGVLCCHGKSFEFWQWWNSTFFSRWHGCIWCVCRMLGGQCRSFHNL